MTDFRAKWEISFLPNFEATLAKIGRNGEKFLGMGYSHPF